MRQEVSIGSSSRGKNGFGDDGSGGLARVEGEEGVEFAYFVIVLFSAFEAATDAMETSRTFDHANLNCAGNIEMEAPVSCRTSMV